MGLWSKIKKGAKKIGGKIKGAIKKVARGIKKVAKKVAYAIPGGKQLWDFSTKVGKKLKKGAMKVMKKLGPVGIMAIQVVLSATGVGAGIAAAMGSLWASMGAAAAASAAAGSVLGTVASAAFNAVNWIGGTLGAVGEALAGGAKKLASGAFSEAASTFGANLGSALTGKAGETAVAAGIEKAAASAALKAAGQGVWSQAVSAGSNALATSGGALSSLGETTTEQISGPDILQAKPLQSSGPAAFDPLSVNEGHITAGPQTDSLVGSFDVAKAADANTSIAQKVWEGSKDVVKEHGTDFIKKQAKSLLSKKSSGQPAAGYQPATNEYATEEYFDPQGAAFSGPQQGQSIQAVQVGGVQQSNSYYNPNAFA